MRCSQPQGLPAEAIEFLQKNGIKANHCSHCDRNDDFEREIIGHVGMFNDVPLLRYHLKDSRTAEEYVQHTI